MTALEAVAAILEDFPFLRERVDTREELFEMPHVTFGLLACELLASPEDDLLLSRIVAFIEKMASLGDPVVDELLVVDLLEGLAQSPVLSKKLRSLLSSWPRSFLTAVEREYFGRRVSADEPAQQAAAPEEAPDEPDAFAPYRQGSR